MAGSCTTLDLDAFDATRQAVAEDPSVGRVQTTKRGRGIRLSLDFRCIAKEVLAGEDDGKPLHRRYVDPATWKRSGSTLVLGDGYSIDAFQRRARGEAASPTALDIVPIDDPL